MTQEQGKKGKCFGFVQDSLMLACNAIHSTVLEGKKLQVNLSRKVRENANEETKSPICM